MEPKNAFQETIPDNGMLRVTIYTDSTHADLSLPSQVEVATLNAAILDLLPHRGDAAPYRLFEPGNTALDGSKTLRQHGIRDGATLILAATECDAPRVLFDDPGEQVATVARERQRPYTDQSRRLHAAAIASGFAGIAGYAAIPGLPGVPHMLFGIAAVGVTALALVPSNIPRGPLRTTVSWLAGFAVSAAIAAMTVVAMGIPVRASGAVAATAGMVAIRAGAPMAAVLAGLSPRREVSTTQINNAHDLMTGLLTAAAALVVLGIVAVVAGPPVAATPRLTGVAFAAATGTALTLRARSHRDRMHIATLSASGSAAMGLSVIGAAFSGTRQWPACAALVCTAALMGLIAQLAVSAAITDPNGSALLRRGADVVESLTLSAVAPLACWLCGGYGLARGLSLG